MITRARSTSNVFNFDILYISKLYIRSVIICTKCNAI
ncbi:hypothetical protein KUCAC02_028528 [Chaenocephalus aceratus]|uniref:Uncharacterized protein n=1 Tax=Chaenocephalus aceratus TaxID=36190 RepID=A0ACB9X2Z4_CHAAC|nr:hypothetical protein KUCAC02_028528 [Chaenocephalus aceratus]